MIISRKKQQKKTKQHGFTIVEVLVIIVVIGVLAGLVIVGYGSIQRNAADTSIEADLRSMSDLQEIYRLDNPSTAGFVYPDGPQDDEFTPSDDNNIVVTLKDGGYCIRGYNDGSSFPSLNESMTYDSLAGGLNKTGGACEGTAPDPDPDTDPDPEPTANEDVISSIGEYVNALQAYKSANGHLPTMPDATDDDWPGADLCTQYSGDCATGSYSWFYDALASHWSDIAIVHAFSEDTSYWPYYQYSSEGANGELLFLLEGESASCGANATSWSWGNNNDAIAGYHWCVAEV